MGAKVETELRNLKRQRSFLFRKREIEEINKRIAELEGTRNEL